MNKPLLTMMALLSILLVAQVAAAESDARFQVHVLHTGGERLTIHEAMQLALPTLWQRVVPMQSLKKAARLRGRTSLVLQFKHSGNGADLVFNPVQVQAYLRQNNITMIVEQPHWSLNIVLEGFGEVGASMATDLIDYSYNISDDLGFQLDSQGENLKLTFTQIIDVYGQTQIKVDVPGAFLPRTLRQAEQPVQGDLNDQLQVWLNHILREIRDAYSSKHAYLHHDAASLYITVVSDATLAGQVALEQLLLQQSEVLSVIPTVIQKESRQYRVTLRNANDSWVASWFASYGMTAVKQPLNSTNQWLIE